MIRIKKIKTKLILTTIISSICVVFKGKSTSKNVCKSKGVTNKKYNTGGENKGESAGYKILLQILQIELL